MRLSSAAFAQMGEIPRLYTCEGKDTSPPLAWVGAPSGTQSFALIVDDPDAPDPAHPKTTWVHWVLYNIPANASAIAEGADSPGTRGKGLPVGTLSGLNDWHHAGYGGPCPPVGRHRYFFKLYALSTVFKDLGSPNKARLEHAFQGQVLAQAELIGTYQKHGR